MTIADITGVKLQGGWNNDNGAWVRDKDAEIDPNLNEIMPTDDTTPAITIDNSPETVIEGFSLKNGVSVINTNSPVPTADEDKRVKLNRNIIVGETPVKIKDSQNILLFANRLFAKSTTNDSAYGVVIEDSKDVELNYNFIHGEEVGAHYLNDSSGLIKFNSIYLNNINTSACAIKLETTEAEKVQIETNVLFIQATGGIKQVAIWEANTTSTPATLLKNQIMGDENLILYRDANNGAGDVIICDYLNDDDTEHKLSDIPSYNENFCVLKDLYVPCNQTPVEDETQCIEMTEVPIPLSGDWDGNGLPDAWEAYYYRDPELYKGDEDDYEENPDKVKTGDGLTVREEYWQHTNPKKWDTDNDGMRDGWEVQYRLNPLSSKDALDDPDGDGYPNIAEHNAGTDPTDPGSYPDYEPIGGIYVVPESGIITINWIIDGGGYQGQMGIVSLEGMDDFTSNLWDYITEVVRRVVYKDGGHIVFSDPEEGAQLHGILLGGTSPLDDESQDWNSGLYKGIKQFKMTKGEKFAVVPCSEFQV